MGLTRLFEDTCNHFIVDTTVCTCCGLQPCTTVLLPIRKWLSQTSGLMIPSLLYLLLAWHITAGEHITEVKCFLLTDATSLKKVQRGKLQNPFETRDQIAVRSLKSTVCIIAEEKVILKSYACQYISYSLG